jgi:hypothetical protein
MPAPAGDETYGESASGGEEVTMEITTETIVEDEGAGGGSADSGAEDSGTAGEPVVIE